jgi:hypothetical protein
MVLVTALRQIVLRLLLDLGFGQEDIYVLKDTLGTYHPLQIIGYPCLLHFGTRVHVNVNMTLTTSPSFTISPITTLSQQRRQFL